MQQLLTNDRRLDMLVGALEGGSNYWYFLDVQQDQLTPYREEGKSLPFAEILWRGILAGQSITVREDDEDGDVLGVIDLKNIQEGE